MEIYENETSVELQNRNQRCNDLLKGGYKIYIIVKLLLLYLL